MMNIKMTGDFYDDVKKVNEAPEKIYLNPLLMEDGESIVKRCAFEKQSDSQIEYTRTNAFIGRAAIWFTNNFMVHDEYGVISDSFDTKEEMYEDFKNYIKSF